MLRDDWQSVNRVLAVRLDNIGDVLMLGPSLRALRAAMPRAHITLMASRAGAQVAPLLPWIDDVIVHRAAWQELSREEAPDPKVQLLLAEALAERHFDAAFIFTSFSQSPYPAAHVAYLAGIPRRIGQSKEWGGQMLTHLVPPVPDETHQVDRNVHLLESVGIPVDDLRLEIDVPPDARQQAHRVLARPQARRRPYIVVAPGASCPARRWPLPRFAEAAELLRERTGADVVVAGSAKEAPHAAQLAERVPGAISIAGQTSIAALAAVIDEAALVVCNDSAPVHLADAAGTPTVVTFSGTELRSQFAPRSTPAVVLGRMTACTPCHEFSCERHLACLDIRPEEVAAAGVAVMQRVATTMPSVRPLEVAHA